MKKSELRKLIRELIKESHGLRAGGQKRPSANRVNRGRSRKR